MLLVLDRASTHCHIRQQVNEVLVVAGVEHLVGSEHAGFLNHAQVHVANGLNACEQVVRRLGIGIVQQALVARALRARLIGVHARDDEELVLDLLGKIAQTRGVLKHRVLTVGRTRADDEHLARVLARKNTRDLGVERLFLLHQLGAERHLLADLHRNGEPALEIHGHDMHLLLSYCGAAV